jgi:Fe-Mn family superoxide dismutase
MLKNHYPFILPPLPYPYNSLEPYIDERTMIIHHDKHFKSYVDNLNAALKDYPQYHSWSIDKLITQADALPAKIRTKVLNNAGGVCNHCFYFDIMGSNNNIPYGEVLNAINNNFGTFEKFKADFKQSALNQFGSGWTWFVIDGFDNLKIINTSNQDTILPLDVCPLFLIDVWEHAYYLKYQNRRDEYIDNWFNVLDWSKIERNYNNCMSYRI